MKKLLAVSDHSTMTKSKRFGALAFSLFSIMSFYAKAQIVEISYNPKFYTDSIAASRPFQQLDDWQKIGAIKSAAAIFTHHQCREPGSADRELAMKIVQLRVLGIGAGIGSAMQETQYENAIAFAIGHLMLDSLDSNGSRVSHACRLARESWR